MYHKCNVYSWLYNEEIHLTEKKLIHENVILMEFLAVNGTVTGVIKLSNGEITIANVANIQIVGKEV